MRSLNQLAGLAAIAALLSLPLLADSRWGPSGCAQPATPSVDGTFIGQRATGYEWRFPFGPKGQPCLYRNGVQVGAWDTQAQMYRALLNVQRGEWGPYQDKAPIDPPPNHVTPRAPSVEGQPKLEAWQLNGVDVDQLCKHERFSINGIAVAEATALAELTKGVLSDDSGKMRLSVWSEDPAKRAKVVADMKSDPAQWQYVTENCLLWDGPAASPKHWLNFDRQGKQMYAISVDPTITLQTPDGVELWRDEGYTQGPASFDGLRKADPNFKPNITPGPKNPSPKGPDGAGGGDPLTLLIFGALAIGALIFFTRKKE